MIALRNRISWDNALGIGIRIPPKGYRSKKYNPPYTELELFYEQWLRDVKGYPEKKLIDSVTNDKLKKEFFYENIEKHPHWFSDFEIEPRNDGVGQYKCKGYDCILKPHTLRTHKHRS